MSSNTSGIQWVPKPLDHPKALIFQQPPRPLLRHQSKSDINGHPSRSDAQPAFKKQRLDHEPDRAAPSPASQVQHKSSVDIDHGSRPSEQALTTADKALSTHSRSTASLLFPLRSTPVQQQARRRFHDAIAKRRSLTSGEVQIKPFVPEPPSPAPRYPSSYKSTRLNNNDAPELDQTLDREGAADFSPWRGNHVEDILSESTIKQGFYDKFQVSQAESSTARPSVWSSLKHKSGLQVLSSLVVSVLDRRQAHGITTTGCTFKPPPRVGLTDSKREAWLRDLSNPNIPLRRLSRTIPHGIRGRALLDQSLAKNIPTARFLWLAKCVGANEIRAFKRKGTSGAFAAGGEAKWIKDWTVNVEQFLDAIIGTCSTQEWTGNLNYGLRLATHLLAEGLLDRDHYFDWLLDAVNQSDLDALSAYLLVIRTYLNELGHCRRFGRRLAGSLLEQLYKINHHPSPNLYNTLRSEIADIIRFFIVSSPASFLQPKNWQEYESMLQAMIGPPDTTLHAHFQDLCKRNRRLQTFASSNHKSEITTSQKIIRILDSPNSGVDIPRTALSLRDIAGDPEMLVHVCLEWSASIYRYGPARSYVVAQLLREWSEMGIDVETCVLTFLIDRSDACGLEKPSLYKAIVELIRSGHFSVSRYLQWVIANGVLREYDQSKTKLSCATGLIFEIPLHGLPAHVLNLRQNLLRSIGVSTEDERRTIAQRKAFIERQLQDEQMEHQNPVDSEDLLFSLRWESLTVKSSVGVWIWQELMVRYRAQQAVNMRSPQESGSSSHSSLHLCHDIAHVRTLVRVLEDVEDFRTMADVLVHYSTSHDPRLLADVAITVNHYLDIFIAIQAANALFMHLFRQHAILDGQPAVAPLTKALVDLSESLPDCSNENRVLQKYLHKYEPRLSIAACSPISEHMAEALQTNASESVSAYTDEVEQLLSSGTSMDKRMVSNVFESIWKRFEATWTDSVESSVATASLISRLASFDVTSVHDLTILSVERTLASTASRPKLMRIGIPLICAQSISLEQLLSRVVLLLQNRDRSIEYHKLLVESLELLMADRQNAESSISSVGRKALFGFPMLMSSQLRYRFYAEQQRFLRGFSPVMVSVLQHVLRYAHTTPKDSVVHISRLLQNPRFSSLLRTLPETAPDFGGISSVLGFIVMMKGAAQTLNIIISPVKDGKTLPRI
ncbi:MAG: hypothetical protein Q9225_001242 [Loekoesia sp. 1 TL-2023]